MLDVKVGDSLFVVFPREKHREGSVDKTYSVIVEKVGRKWIEVSNIFYPENAVRPRTSGRGYKACRCSFLF